MNVEQAYIARSKAAWLWSFDKLNPDLLAEVKHTDSDLIHAIALRKTPPPPHSSFIEYEGTQYMLESISPQGVCNYVSHDKWDESKWEATKHSPHEITASRISCIPAVEESIFRLRSALAKGD